MTKKKKNEVEDPIDKLQKLIKNGDRLQFVAGNIDFLHGEL